MEIFMLAARLNKANDISPSAWDWFSHCLNNWDELLNEPLRHNRRVEGDDGGGMDVLAWYSPRSTYNNDLYGIHFLDAGIVQWADGLMRGLRAKNVSPGVDLKGACLLWSAQTLYTHELCHAWIEGLLDGVNSGTLYHQKLTSSGTYIPDEEAMCNTAVYGFQNLFMSNIRDDFPPQASADLNSAYSCLIELCKIYPGIMLTTLSDEMTNQPDGYKWFKNVDTAPAESIDFVFDLLRLLIEEYGCTIDKSAIAVEAFLKTNDSISGMAPLLDSIRKLQSQPPSDITAFSFADVPIYFHIKPVPSLIELKEESTPEVQGNETKVLSNGGSYFIHSVVAMEDAYRELTRHVSMDSQVPIARNLYIDASSIEHASIEELSANIEFINGGDFIFINPNPSPTGGCHQFCKVKGLKKVVCVIPHNVFMNITKAFDIVNKHLKKRGKCSECREELIENDLKGFV
jgi:hypothetical protein